MHEILVGKTNTFPYKLRLRKSKKECSTFIASKALAGVFICNALPTATSRSIEISSRNAAIIIDVHFKVI